MKDSIVNLLEDFEKLAYKLVLWIIIIPKTILKIIINPAGMRDYVYNELDNKPPQFDRYISPLFLYLGVTLIPFLLLNIAPVFGLTIATPADDQEILASPVVFNISEETILEENYPEVVKLVRQEEVAQGISKSTGESQFFLAEFWVEAIFKADATYNYHYFEWVVSQCEDSGCTKRKVIGGETHDEYSQSMQYIKDEDNKSDPNSYIGINVLDRNAVSDSFFALLPAAPGQYQVSVNAYNIDRDTGKNIEQYNGNITVIIPVRMEDIQFQNANQKIDTGASGKLEDQLKSSNTIVLGLIFLLPPLLFAFLVAYSGRHTDKSAEDDLKKNFYAQCYYFSPPALAFWAFIHASYFVTNDISTGSWLFLPWVFALVWFVFVELNAIADVLPSKSKMKAFLVMAGGLIFFVVVLLMVLVFFGNNDILRSFAINGYYLGGLLLVIWVIFPPLKRWWQNRVTRRDQVPPSDFQTPADG